MNAISFPVNKHYDTDVLVVGGGTAGFAAAICAARSGAKVMLCEKDSCLGGMPTSALVGPFMTCYDPDDKIQVIRGFFEEFVRRLEKEGGAIHPSHIEGGTGYASYRIRGHAHVTPFDCEVFKRVAEQMCIESGVKILYNVYFQCCAMEGESIRSAVFSGKSGMFDVSARLYIDCTGDADVAFSAGAPCEKGENNDGNLQPVSIFFLLDGIDKAPMDQWVQDHKDEYSRWFFGEELKAARARGEFPIPRSKVEMYEEIDGAWRINMARVNGVDGTDPEAVTAALIELRQQIPIIVSFLRKHVPGCQNARLRTSGSTLGVRETRRIIGSFVLNHEDMSSAVPFEDTIFLSGNLIDIHQGATVYYVPIKSGCAYPIPYRVLLPQKVNNLLVAGRSISATRQALGAIRVIPPCIAMGQAAGTAAALCIKHNTAPSDVNIAELQVALRAQGAVLSESDLI
ncbi:MAG: FAD-dependent oxidoreductase [Clostridia bacterium]|nr:FAD-dependent oxidoreductase [Clostridia bacterium]